MIKHEVIGSSCGGEYLIEKKNFWNFFFKKNAFFNNFLNFIDVLKITMSINY
jgi:hypothetical protein